MNCRPTPAITTHHCAPFAQRLGTQLPWQLPLADWAAESLPSSSGITAGLRERPGRPLTAVHAITPRHPVRCVYLSPSLLAVKETTESSAQHEYETLLALNKRGLPAVLPCGWVAHRSTPAGTSLPGAVITHHLGAMPFPALAADTSRGPLLTDRTVSLALNALAVLVARLHTAGVYWGDASLANTLFAHTADGLSAHLVDAETAEVFPRLSAGMRLHDVKLATENIAGELSDLSAAGLIAQDLDLPCLISEFKQMVMMWTAVARVSHYS